MATVNDVKWYYVKDGKCPMCNRERQLGRLNYFDTDYPRCIDCCFGPPMDYWDMCESCGQLYVGEHCDNPKCNNCNGIRRYKSE